MDGPYILGYFHLYGWDQRGNRLGTNQGFSGYSKQKSLDSPKQISKEISIVLLFLTVSII